MPEARSTMLGSGAAASSPAATTLRTTLVLAALSAVALAWLAGSGMAQAVDPPLATLLRGMAALKGLLAVAAAGAVWWRLGHATSTRIAAVYIACACLMLAASVSMGRLAFIAPAAVIFHLAGFVGMVVALREGRGGPRIVRPAGRAPRDAVARRAAAPFVTAPAS